MTASRKVKLYTGLMLVGVFALGTLAGGAVALWTSRGGTLLAGGCHPGPHQFGPWSLARLNLSPEQERAAHEIFESYRPQLDAVLRVGFPKVRKITEKIDKDIRALLNSEQKVLFDSLQRERLKRRGPMAPSSRAPFLGGPHRDGRPPPFPPPPF